MAFSTALSCLSSSSLLSAADFLSFFFSTPDFFDFSAEAPAASVLAFLFREPDDPVSPSPNFSKTDLLTGFADVDDLSVSLICLLLS